MMLLCAGLALGGHIRFTFFPRIDSDRINVRAELPFGTPVEVTEKVEAQMLKHAQTLLAKYEEEKGSRWLREFTVLSEEEEAIP